jgi:hypothetical protein
MIFVKLCADSAWHCSVQSFCCHGLLASDNLTVANLVEI